MAKRNDLIGRKRTGPAGGHRRSWLAAAAMVASLAARQAAGQSWMPGAASTAPSPRYNHAMAYDRAQRVVVLFGGETATGKDGQTFLYDGVSWIQGPAAPPALTPRSGHAMAADSDQVILFGGRDAGGDRRDTWLFSGGSWTPGIATASVPPRSLHGMAYEPLFGDVVIFGGFSGGTFLNDCWRYIATGWTPGPAAPPGLTRRAAVAMTSGTNDVVVHGGFTGSAALDETWSLYGQTWTQIAAGPSARESHAAAWSDERGALVLFGGFSGGSENDETWEHDGSVWTIGPAAPAGMVGRERHAMAYDQDRGVVVLFGGFDGAAELGDTWEYETKGSYLVGGGHAQSSPNRVRVVDESCAATSVDFYAYGAGQWGCNVAAGDVNGGLDEILTGPGPGAVFGPHVRGFYGTGPAIAKLSFYAYSTLKNGVNVDDEGIDDDGLLDPYQEIVTGAGPGSVFGPHVRVFNFDNAAVVPIQRLSFFAYGTLKYGVNVGGGDVDGDYYDEMLTGPGPGIVFSPTVRGFDGTGVLTQIPGINFDIAGPSQYGAGVAGGNVAGSSEADIVAWSPFTSCTVQVFSPPPVTALYALRPFNGPGCHAGVADVGLGWWSEVLVGEGAASGVATVQGYSGTAPLPCSFDAFPGFPGATVTGGRIER